jgi:hypothetical protein
MKNTKNIEVEFRGPLTKDQYDILNAFFQKEAVFEQKKDRVLIDYSAGMKERTKDIRIRETNGIPEMIVKLGAWGGSDQREEIALTTKEGTFDMLVRIFGELGYEKGVLCVRNSQVYKYKGIEFALVEIPGHSYTFEAEILAESGTAGEAEAKIKKVCAELKLKVFTSDEFFVYVETLNREANIMFDYKKYQDGYFRDKRYLKK